MSDVQALMILNNKLRSLVRRLEMMGDLEGATKARAALKAFQQLNQVEAAE